MPLYFFLCPNDVTLLSVWLIGLWTPGEQASHVTYLLITAGFGRDVVKLIERADRPTLSSEFLIWLSHFTVYLFSISQKMSMGAGDGKQTIPKTTINITWKELCFLIVQNLRTWFMWLDPWKDSTVFILQTKKRKFRDVKQFARSHTDFFKMCSFMYFFLKFKHLFLAALDLLWAFSSSSGGGRGATLHCSTWPAHCGGFPCCRGCTLGCELSDCGTWA